MLKKKMKKQAGFTVVELIVAMTVGAILAGSTTLLIVEQARLSQLGRDVTLANSFAETQIEGLRSAGYNNLSSGTTDITSQLPDELKPPRDGSLVISDGTTGLKQVEISITYNDQGQQRTFNYTTYIGELGVGQN